MTVYSLLELKKQFNDNNISMCEHIVQYMLHHNIVIGQAIVSFGIVLVSLGITLMCLGYLYNRNKNTNHSQFLVYIFDCIANYNSHQSDHS